MKIFKQLLCLVLAVILCLSLVACKDDADTTDAQNTEFAPCTEQDIRILMEGNLDCVYCFFVLDTLKPTGKPDKDGYYKADDNFFKTYTEFENFVKDIYTQAGTEYLFTMLCVGEDPVYKNVNDTIYVNPNNMIDPGEYNIIWDDTYTVNLYPNEDDDTICDFECLTKDGDADYGASGTAVFEDGKWKFDNLVY